MKICNDCTYPWPIGVVIKQRLNVRIGGSTLEAKKKKNIADFRNLNNESTYVKEIFWLLKPSQNPSKFKKSNIQKLNIA